MSQAIEQLLDGVAALQRKAKDGFETLRTCADINGRTLSLFFAGKQNGRVHFGLFGRDLLTVALMVQAPRILKSSIQFVSATLGKRYDPMTGEEPGRGLHEYSDVVMRGLSTRYNAAEVSLLLLIAAASYWRITKDIKTIQEHKKPLAAAIAYLRGHLGNGLFFEDPRRCGAKHYAIPSTYWKDAGLPGRADPDYPVSYTLVQAQAAAALRAGKELVGPLEMASQTQEGFERSRDEVVSRLSTDLWDDSSNYPLIARDRRGKVAGISSDALHMLAYLRKGDLPTTKLEAIVKGAHQLETPYGYRTYAPGQPEYAPDSYHLGSIWPYEQFFIAKGALLHGLEEILDHSLRIIDGLEMHGFPELLVWDGETLTAGGCDLQLWSAAYPQAICALLARHLAR